MTSPTRNTDAGWSFYANPECKTPWFTSLFNINTIKKHLHLYSPSKPSNVAASQVPMKQLSIKLIVTWGKLRYGSNPVDKNDLVGPTAAGKT